MKTTKHTAKKRFGQNFLHDQYIIAQIIKIINPISSDFMVEIGPGLAALTRPLLEHIAKLHVVEIDRDIVSFLTQNFADRLDINSGDALKFDYSFAGEKIRIVGNLPYNISTPLLFHLSSFDNIIDMHFMLQKEVVERICATPNGHDYGRLSVMLQYKFNCRKMLDVSPECFDPKPKVDSAIIRLTPKDKQLWQHIDEKKLNHIVTLAFGQRRKTISNSLKPIFSQEQLLQLNIDPKKRAENLTIDEYMHLTMNLNNDITAH